MAAKKGKAKAESGKIGPDTVVTTSELAVWLEVDERTIRKLAAKGVLEKVGRGRYRLRDAITAYIRRLRSKLDVRVKDAPDLAEARARLAEAQRKVQELKALELQGKLVRREVVEEIFGRITAALRAGLLSIPSKARGRLPHLTAADSDVLEELIRDVLADVPEEAGLPPEVMADDEEEADAERDAAGSAAV